MRYYEATSTIAASLAAVWAVLSDGARRAAWDSGVDAVEGRITLGATMKIRPRAAPGHTFPVKVTMFEPPARLRFSGGISSDLGPSFDRFARGLKPRVESGG